MSHIARMFALSAAIGLGATSGFAQETDTGSDSTGVLSFAAPLAVRSSGRSDIPGSFAVAAPDVVELGWGWSEQRGEAIPTQCILFSPASGDAQTSNISISEVSDSYTLSKALDVSASTTLRGFGAKVEGKASIAKSSKMTSMTITYVVRAEVLNDSIYVAPQQDDPVLLATADGTLDAGDTAAPPVGASVRLTDAAVALAETDEAQFRRVCGDGYVSAAVSGARAYLVSVIQTSSKTEREQMRASVTGEGWGQKASVSAKKSTEGTTNRFNRDLTFFQEGGSAKTADPVVVPSDGGTDATPEPFSDSDLPADADQAIARIKKLATAARDAGKLFEISVSPYEALANYPNAGARSSDTDEHEDLAAMLGAYETLYDSLTVALADPAGYAAPVRSCTATACEVGLKLLTDPAAFRRVEDAQDIALFGLNQLEQLAQECFDEGDDCSIDLTTVRSPYAALVNAPIPVTGAPAVIPPLADQVAIFMRDTAAARCRLGSRTPGCITNAMIRAWVDRQGMQSVKVSKPQDTISAIAGCKSVVDKLAYRGDADDPDAKVVWVNASVLFDGNGAVQCPAD